MHVFSVSQFIAYLNETFKAVWDPHQACVEGEVSGFRVSQGQWVNFDVKDADALVAVFMVLRQLTMPVQDGMRVRLYGYPRVYPKYGKMSFNAERVELVGEGSLRKALALLREKLAAEGMFESSRKRPLPRFPRKIALVASRESAAYGDFIRILHDRWRGLEIDLYHVLVQGEKAPADIVRAVRDAQGEAYDILVLTRGGGSLEELMAFNDEGVVRAIFASKIPTLVGIGHERDLTLAEEAADVRGSTPTDCARRLVPDRKDVLYEIATLQESVADTLHLWLDRYAERLTATGDAMERWRAAMRDKTIFLFEQIGKWSEQWLAKLGERTRALERLVRSCDPASVVERGYAIVRGADGAVRVSVRGLTAGEHLGIEMRDGNAETVVRSVTRYDKEKT